MTKREAYRAGREQGMSAAKHTEVGESDRREAGCACQGADGACVECLTSAAFESEMHSRDFSPWEFLAHSINESGDRAEGLWEAYDAGVAAGIKAGIKARLSR